MSLLFQFPILLPYKLFLDDMEPDDEVLVLDDRLVLGDKVLERMVVGDPPERIRQ